MLTHKNYLILLVLFLPIAAIFSNPIILSNEDFENCASISWTAVNVSGADIWECTPDAGCTNNYFEINGFGGGDLEEDWLISPSVNLDLYDNEYFCFQYRDHFDGPDIELLYSSDFSGTYDIASVNSATWNSISLNLYDLSTDFNISDPIPHHAIDVSGITGTNIYFAFKYHDTAPSSARWHIDNISITADYYANIENAIPMGLSCEDLKNELTNLIKDHTVIPYTDACLDVKKTYWTSDSRLNDAGTATIVWDMFTDIPGGADVHEFTLGADFDDGTFGVGEGVLYNREHTFPKSWWGSGTTYPTDTIYFDLHHVVPSDKFLNGEKLNYPPSEVDVADVTGTNGFQIGTSAVTIPGYTFKVYEPIDEYKGDYARMHFYLATRYGHNFSTWAPLNARGDAAILNNSYPAYESWLVDLLLTWHENDPVSIKETDRNDAIFCVQNNRNPFIDHPEYVGIIWGYADGTPCMVSPLPLELTDFFGKKENANSLLFWKTSSEINVNRFEIERSQNGLFYEKIGTVAAFNRSENHYQFIDKFPFEKNNYYRLKMIDEDGSFEFSKNIVIFHEEESTFEIFPSPAKDFIYLKNANEIAELEIIDALGKIWMTFQSDNQVEQKINISELPIGHYFFKNKKRGKVLRFVKW